MSIYAKLNTVALVVMFDAFTGGQRPLGGDFPLSVILSEEQAPEGALQAARSGAAGCCRLAPQTLHGYIRQWPTALHLCCPLIQTQLDVLNQPGGENEPEAAGLQQEGLNQD